MPIDRRITLDGFLRAFRRQDRNQPDQPFCFILGAGASKPSGIRTGGELAQYFVEEMYKAENFDEEPLERWTGSGRLGIINFQLERAAEFYPELYQRMFEHPDDGYAFLEKEMEDREPSYGYSVLAWILANTLHKVVITPNFDNLVADALSIHSATFPRVVGHDSLAGFVQAALRRPLIAKVHGDLGFTPRNRPDEITHLSEEWKTALGRVLDRFTPIVIGYGGNDGSLMAALESLPENVPDSIYWCHREGAPVSERVLRLLEKRKGRLVVVPGFDELMLKLQDHMVEDWTIPDLLGAMKSRQREREESYDRQRREIAARLAAPRTPSRTASNESGTDVTPVQETTDLAGAAVRLLAPKEGEKPWWQWYQEAAAAPDPGKRESIYIEAIHALPQSAELLATYADFRASVKKDIDGAEDLYNRAITADPNSAISLGMYAVFLEYDRKDPDRAEDSYKLAIEKEPENSVSLSNYALFLSDVRKDMDRAEDFYRRAIAADPEYANALGNYAVFLQNVRRDSDRAETFYKRAIDADPKHANNLGNYASFLLAERDDLTHAEKLFEKAIELDPQHANNLANYAGILLSLKKAAGFELLSRAEKAPTERLDLALERLFYRVAHDPNAWPGRLGELHSLLQKGVRSPTWRLDRNIERAEQDGHPNPTLLRALAKVINDEAPLESLNDFPEWKTAKDASRS